MEAAIEKILSSNIDIDDAEAGGDFAEGSSGSEDEQRSEVSSEEEDAQHEDGSEPESGDDEGSEGDEEDDEQADMDAGLGGTSSEDDEGVEGTEGAAARQMGFLEGGKDETFARAFARIVDSSGGLGGAPILLGSKSIAKRRAEDEEQAKADRAAKRLRIEMKRRGHVVPGRRGTDPAADAREKALQRTATRGVVRLFNAIAKAQRRLKQTEDATGSKAKAARLGKASFLAELRNSYAGGAGAEGAGTARADGDRDGDGDGEDGSGWEVLQKGFTGLQGGSKMKDWDRKGASVAEESDGVGADSGSDGGGGGGDDDDGDDDGDGW